MCSLAVNQEGHGMGGACSHNKALGLSHSPHQQEFCTGGLLGWYALCMLGRTQLSSSACMQLPLNPLPLSWMSRCLLNLYCSSFTCSSIRAMALLRYIKSIEASLNPAEVEITSGHRSISVHIDQMTAHNSICVDIVSRQILLLCIVVPQTLVETVLLCAKWVSVKPGTVDSGLDSWTGLWTEIWTWFWTDAQFNDDHFQETVVLQLQASRKELAWRLLVRM